MKKIAALTIIMTFSLCLFAQDIKTAETFFTNKEYDKAKTAIDNATNGSLKNDPKAWIWKHKIYQAIGQNTKPADAASILLSGFEALKKAMAMPNGTEASVMILGLKTNEDFNNYYTWFINNGSALM